MIDWKQFDQQEIENIYKIGLVSGNTVILDMIQNKKIKIYKDTIYDVCKYGNRESFEFLKQKNHTLNLKDENGWTCLHYAAKYGNSDLLNYFVQEKYDFNQTNNKQETPLHVCLKYGIYKYVKNSLIMFQYTNMLLRDDQNNEPHRIHLRNLQNNARLGQILENEFENQMLQNQM